MADAMKPRLLLVTRNLPPLVGGMERLNWHMAEELAKTCEVKVIGPTGSAALAPSGVDVREVPLQPLWKFLLAACREARTLARQWKPDIVLAGSGLTAPIARSAARVAGAKAAVYVHGLDVAVSHPVYRLLWLPAIRRMDRVIANSTPTAQLCRAIGVPEARIAIVHPGVTLPAPADPAAIEDFRVRHGLQGRALLLSVGRLSTRKGLREFVAQALPRIAAARPDVLLLIVGNAPTQALHAQTQTPASIQAAADAAGVGQHICFLGKITDEELKATYRIANVHVFPVREIPGDPEGFGMVAIEAAAHGLPTVAFATGGVVNSVSPGQSGYLVEPDDYGAMAQAVMQLLDYGLGAWGRGTMDFALGFAWPIFGQRLAAALLVSVP